MSGAGKTAALKALEDLGYEAVDNAPLALVPELVGPGTRRRAPARDRHRHPDARFHRRRALRAAGCARRAAGRVRPAGLSRLRRRGPGAAFFGDPAPPPARRGGPADRGDRPGARAARAAPRTRRRGDRHIGPYPRRAQAAGSPTPAGWETRPRPAISLVSFAYRNGLPPDADIVLDVRFLANPHYEADLAPLTGLDAAVGAFVGADPAFAPFFESLNGFLAVVLPRYRARGQEPSHHRDRLHRGPAPLGVRRREARPPGSPGRVSGSPRRTATSPPKPERDRIGRWA